MAQTCVCFDLVREKTFMCIKVSIFSHFGKVVAEIAAAAMGHGPWADAGVRRADGTRTGRGRTFIARRSGRSRGAGTLRWTACFTARRRRTWATRSTAARWTTPPMTPALLTLGTPPVSEERSGADPAAAPKLSLSI